MQYSLQSFGVVLLLLLLHWHFRLAVSSQMTQSHTTIANGVCYRVIAFRRSVQVVDSESI